MNLGAFLTVLIPLVVLGYAAFLLVRMVRDRRKGRCSLGGCGHCPMRDGCGAAKQGFSNETAQKKQPAKDDDPHAP